MECYWGSPWVCPLDTHMNELVQINPQTFWNSKHPYGTNTSMDREYLLVYCHLVYTHLVYYPVGLPQYAQNSHFLYPELNPIPKLKP